jgi:hypothetical protein
MGYYFVFVKPFENEDVPLIKEVITDDEIVDNDLKKSGKKKFMIIIVKVTRNQSKS